MSEVEHSREAKLAEIVREIALRRNVYNDLIKQGRMKRVEADKRIEIMVQIAKDYGGTG